MISKLWPWNRLPEPTPADWRIGMTICIAAICANSGQEAIISASDRMVSMGGYFSGDNVVRKIDPIAYGWSSMIAGNDVSPAIPILGKVDEKRVHGEVTLKAISTAVKSAYREQRLEEIEDDILSPMGFTWQDFRTVGKAQLSERVYDRLIERIRSYELYLTFLVQGYDDGGEAHIFTVENPGKCDYYDKLGFWAIGSGQHQAVASLFSSKYSKFATLEECVAQVMAAKLIAESASGVGKETWVLVEPWSPRNRTIFIKSDYQRKFRKAWEGLPTLPEAVIPELKAILDDEMRKLNEEKKEAASKVKAAAGAAPPSDTGT